MKKINFILALLTLSACGPIYSTDYEFTLPKSTSGKYCIQNCEDYQTSCGRNMNESKDACEADNQRLVEDCNNRIENEKHRAPKWTECGRQLTCDYPVSRCEEEFRNCYRSCGGDVREVKTCVLNCDKVAPPPAKK
jgi:hypothetical protein